MWPLLKRCEVPIVGIAGANSELMRPPILKRWKKLHQISKIHQIPNSGHLVPLEKPEECAAIINRHIG